MTLGESEALVRRPEACHKQGSELRWVPFSHELLPFLLHPRVTSRSYLIPSEVMHNVG